jgi:uncharacterized membrane protein YjgN (DUF898 family)
MKFLGCAESDSLPFGMQVFLVRRDQGSFIMSIRKATMAAIVAVSMVVVPTVAQAATQSAASKLSVRSAQKISGSKESKARPGSTIIAIMTAIAVVGGIGIGAGGGSKSTSK